MLRKKSNFIKKLSKNEIFIKNRIFHKKSNAA